MAIRNHGTVRHLGAWLLVLVVALTACGDGTDDPAGNRAGDTGATSAVGESTTAGSDGSSSPDDGSDPAGGGTGAAMATLVVGDETYKWEGNQWTYCEIGGLFPANAEFQTEQDKRSGNWVQFIDRGDGGINFSAILDGREFAGTGSGEADEITSNGFTFTGSLNNSGTLYDVRLEVNCG